MKQPVPASAFLPTRLLPYCSRYECGEACRSHPDIRSADWDSVSLSDVRYYIQRQIRRYKHLRSSIRPDAAKKAESIRGEWKKLSSALAGKRALRGLADIDKAILELERKMKEPERINPFDSYELDALKSDRDRRGGTWIPARSNGSLLL